MNAPVGSRAEMKVALVYPRLRHQTKSFLPPLGVALVATLARDAGYDVRMFDSSFDPDLSNLKRDLAAFAPAVVASSVSSDLYPAACEVSDLADSMGAVSVMGGPHATLAGEELLQETPSLGVVVAGEAEDSFVELLDRIERGAGLEGVRGLIYRQGDETIENPAEPWHEDLDVFPFPDRDLLPTYPRYSHSGFTELILSRSCPFSCTYCQPTLAKVSGHHRKRGPKNVVDEIEMLWRKYGNRSFLIDDDIFVLDKAWLRGIVEQLEARGLAGKFRFVALGRPDTFDEEAALLLKRMGLYYLLFGMESGSQKMLDTLGKQTTVEQIRRAFRLAKKHGFRTHAFVILGAPGETPRTLRLTEDLIKELAPHSVFISLFAPTLGTSLCEDLEKQGRLKLVSSEHVSYYSWLDGALTYESDTVTYEEVAATRDRILASRRPRFLASNALDAVGTLLRERSISRVLMRASFYKTQKKFHG